MERIVFHFNKAHNTDPDNIAPWIIKYKGQSYYVWNVVSERGFNTKQTPDNPHTKGSLMMRGDFELREEDGKSVGYIK